jgi:hypothetical protein
VIAIPYWSKRSVAFENKGSHLASQFRRTWNIDRKRTMLLQVAPFEDVAFEANRQHETIFKRREVPPGDPDALASHSDRAPLLILP